MTNMRATRGTRSLLRTCALTCFLFLLCSTCAGAATRRNVASHPSTSKRSRRSHQSAKHMGAHHRPLTDEQKADQNLQFMLSLYRSAAEPDGRPKQHRKFGSNTVRLLRPTASSVHYRPTSGGERSSQCFRGVPANLNANTSRKNIPEFQRYGSTCALVILSDFRPATNCQTSPFIH